MARKNNHNDDRGSQPTWADVSRTIQALEQEYGGHVEVSMDVEGARGAAGQLWVYAKLYRSFVVLAERPVDVVRCLWPTLKAREMPSLVFRLLYQLDHSAEARRQAEAGARP